MSGKRKTETKSECRSAEECREGRRKEGRRYEMKEITRKA